MRMARKLRFWETGIDFLHRLIDPGERERERERVDYKA